ncbi:MAG: SurA N-terminal domain-containing protein [Pseudomonadota bacterium]
MTHIIKAKSGARSLVIIALGTVLAACNSTDNAVPKSSTTVEQPIVAEQPVATGVPQVETITARGGNKIAALVNRQPITTNAVARRARFRKLRRERGGRAAAKQELIDEAIKMQEARRVGALASDAEVNRAYSGFVQRNRLTQKQFAQVLNRAGVGTRAFKNYIKAQISWQRAVSIRVQRQAAGVSSTQRNTQRWLPAQGSSSAREQEYTIQQIVFTVPKNNQSQLPARRTQANNFRNRINGCENARELATTQKDVAVIDRGRVLDSRLPTIWAKDIRNTQPGKVTRVRDTEKGAEMIVVCRKREVIGSQSADEAKLFEGDNFRNAASAEEKKYFAELKKKAVIVNR